MNMTLDPWQMKFLDTKGDKILCCGRQVGKTEICSKDAGDYAVRNVKSVILMIAPTERQARLLFEKTLDYLLSNFPNMVIKGGKDRPTKERIALRNKTKIFCLPTGVSGITIRGRTINRLYVDEASRVPEEVWGAVTPMLLTTGGSMILLSTPFGAQGEFHRIWINKESAYDSFTRFSATSETVMENRTISATWTQKQRDKSLEMIERAKRRMSKREYAQEYLGEFLEELDKYFPDELIQNCCVLKKRDTIRKYKTYYLGVDIARMGEDESTFEIIERLPNGNLEHIENIITRKTLTTQTENKILQLEKLYNFRKIAIDAGSGSLGVGIYDQLLRKEGVRTKIEAVNNAARTYDRLDKSKAKLLKEDLYDNLRGLMERGEIQLLKDDDVIESLRSIQYEYVTRSNQATRLRIFGTYTHIVEGIIRACWYAKSKQLNIWVRSIRV